MLDFRAETELAGRLLQAIEAVLRARNLGGTHSTANTAAAVGEALAAGY